MEHILNTPKRPKKRRFTTLSFEATPSYLHDNPFIRIGYRPELDARAAIMTLFRWHNETLNIWSHIAGFAIFAAFFVQTILKPTQQMPIKWPLYVFQWGALTVFTTSTLFHLMCCVSSTHYKNYRRMDFAGIVLVMWSMFWPWVIYSFGQTIARIVYLVAASVVATFTTLTAFSDGFQDHRINSVRPFLFAVQGVLGTVPLIHASVLYWDAIRPATYMVVIQLALHFVGAILYATKIPERYAPGTFDIIGNSHTLFHLFILGGFVSFHQGIVHLATNKIH